MKKTIITVISSFLIASSVPAAIDITTAYTTDYYFRGFQLADAIIETAVDYSEGDFYLGAWTAQPFTDAEDGSDYENEIDFYGGYGVALSDTVALDLGLTAYVYPELDSGDTETYEVFLGIAFDSPLAPSIYAYYDMTLEIFTYEGSIGYSMPIDEASSFDLGATVGSTDGEFYYLLSAGYGLSIGETASFSASVNYTDGNDAIVAGNWDDGLYVNVGLSVGF